MIRKEGVLPAVTVRRAETEADFQATRALCQAFVDWQLATFPDLREKILAYFEPRAYARTLAELPLVHARPKGAILLAERDGRPLGCVMYHEMEPGVAEVKRLFVAESARGLGLGRALLEAMFDLMRTDGYTEVRLESARFLTDAKRLYDKMGFVEITPPSGSPEHAYFMKRPLRAAVD